MISIITVIPTFNRKEKLSIIVNQLLTQDLPENLDLKIIIVIDGSISGILEMVQTDFPSVSVVLGNGNWWYTKSMNEGFKYAQKFKPDYILTLNDDVEIANNYVSTLLRDFNSINDSNSILGSMSVTNTEEKLIHFSGIKGYSRSGMKNYPYIKTLSKRLNNEIYGIYSTYELPGRGILIPNKILNKLDYFDCKFIQYGSDTDFCFRAIKENINVFISWNAVVLVNIELTRVRVYSGKNNALLFLKDTFDKYSHNSLRKFITFQLRHYPIMHIFWKIPYFYFANLWVFIKKEK